MIRVQNLTIQVPGFQVAGLNLQVEPGEFFVVLGPTGSGKTLILEAVAGLTPISSGQIIIGGRDVTRENPERRGVGVVYQDSALFPHLTVRQNITYGFRYQKQDRNKDPQRLRMLVERLGIGHILNRSVTHLSGGEK
ncbi:MAG: ATP-binding cassette domain-containing protein, partial [Proteobacteria bacterium]|nr:ATP-binding cassette domain-containing protein [Pseudomonadota bacterium]